MLANKSLLWSIENCIILNFHSQANKMLEMGIFVQWISGYIIVSIKSVFTFQNFKAINLWARKTRVAISEFISIMLRWFAVDRVALSDALCA